MGTSIPSIDYPVGMTPPTPSAGSSSSGIPALPALPDISSMLGVDTSQGTLTGLAAAANGVSANQQASNQDNSVVGKTTAVTNSFFSQLTEWLKSIAVPGTLALVGLLIIILSVYIAVTSAKNALGKIK
jgi:hypothetical protein